MLQPRRVVNLKLGRLLGLPTQTAQQSSDIVNKNQLLMINLSPDAAYVADPSHKSHEPRPFGVPPYSFCKSSLLMHVPSLHLLPTWITWA